MTAFLLSSVIVLVGADRLRAWLIRREIEIDDDREYRAPPIIGTMPNMPPG